MAEIRLICPGCAAEYRIPDTAIPAEGREVECSACGNVWYATATPARPDAADPSVAAAPTDLPRLNRRLPDTVLDILRDEVEHERRARAADGPTGLPGTASSGPRLVADPEWPATTITRHIHSDPVESVAPAPSAPRPAPAANITGQSPSAVTARPETAAPVEPAPAAAPPPMPAAPSADRGYAAGFGLAVLLAAVLIGLYVLSPSLTDRGTFGDRVMDLRAQADDARFWLQDRAAILIR
ncbi:zinc-ribbon domain-containing protein [Paracoccus sediminis]|uniref:MJ0042 family finger-like domain-containing protein n=2 Tax=Paracoccus sediminis TaxID=1214787 RepID=A0A238VXE3_9RHOB|nr:zinc-ribbon domain-containing protein [Paracoccus sediminis]SNR39005.1 MJ0042 family finger-like domain-containing protein [Paracoccus sediminis]